MSMTSFHLVGTDIDTKIGCSTHGNKDMYQSQRVGGIKIVLQIIIEPNSIGLGIGIGIGVRRCEHAISPYWTRYCLKTVPFSRI